MLQMISTTLHFRKVIHSDRMYYTASLPVHILQWSDSQRITSIADALECFGAREVWMNPDRCKLLVVGQPREKKIPRDLP